MFELGVQGGEGRGEINIHSFSAGNFRFRALVFLKLLLLQSKGNSSIEFPELTIAPFCFFSSRCLTT
jgi:hypothetical protein